MVTPFQLTDTGGVTSAVLALRKELTSAGHAVDVLVPADSDHVVRLADGLYGIYLRLPVVPGARLKSMLGFAAHLPLTLLALRRFLRRTGVEVVAVQYPLPWMFYFGILRRMLPFRLVVTYQGSDAHDLASSSSTDRRLIGVLLRSADAIIAVSRTLADKVSAAIPGISRDRFRVIPNGASECDAENVEVAGLPNDYVVTVGRLIRRKAVDVLIDAVGIAHERGVRMNLVIVGDGPERAALQDRAARLGIASAIYFVGMRSQVETRAIMRGSRFFVLASRAEGLPLVIAEAMACAKPVVATAVDGVPDIVTPSENGLLVPPDDAGALADALCLLHRNEALQQQLADNALHVYRKSYTWRAIAARYSDIF